MKSLILVNKLINEINEYNESNKCKQPTKFEASITITDSQLRTIKQDLEVLGIIKNRNVNLFKLKRVFTNLEDIDDVLLAYNACSFRNEQITLEEIEILKKWLEENE